MSGAVELAAASLPWAIRDRYREEWRHDLEHAGEAGVRQADVAWGAVRAAIIVDRMQAPSTAHAILQARLRIDSAGTHGSTAMLLGLIAWQSRILEGGAVTFVLVLAVILHAIVMLVQLQLAALIVGGRVQLAVPVWIVGGALAAGAAVLGLAGHAAPWWLWIAAAGCCITASILAEAHKPAKPELHERVRPGMRHRLLLVGAATSALTVALCLLEALVVLPLRSVPGADLAEAWRTLGAGGWLASPLLAGLLLTAAMLVPLALGMLGARRARTERGMLGWAASGALFAVIATLIFCSLIAPITTILPLLAGALLHLTMRSNRDLAPLPPASVPLPPGPWHIELDVPNRGRVTG